MPKNYSRLMILLIFFLAILPLVSSAPPVLEALSNQNTGIDIKYPNIQYLKQGQDYDFNFHLFNKSSGNPIQDETLGGRPVNCSFHLYDSTGEHIFAQNLSVANNWDYIFDWYVDVEGNNFSKTGIYSYIFQCNTSRASADAGIGGYVDNAFEVTPNGEEATIGKAVFYIGLLFVLLFFLALCILSFVQFENIMNRVGMIGMGYLLLMAITFIGWNMASDFITSAPFLAEMLRILFWVFIIGAFPLLIGGFAWYLLLLFKIKEIENLIDHGMSRDEAEHRQGKTFKGGKH